MREITNFIKTISSRLSYIIDKDEKFTINIVMGNSSCDLDSVTSSFYYSFMRNLECGAIACENENKIAYNIKEKNNEIFIPVINCPKGELFWRLDINQLLSKVGIKETDLFYFTDIFNSQEGKIEFKQIGKCYSIFYFTKKIIKSMNIMLFW